MAIIVPFSLYNKSDTLPSFQVRLDRLIGKLFQEMTDDLETISPEPLLFLDTEESVALPDREVGDKVS